MNEPASESQTIITIGIVDDHALFAEAVAVFLGIQPGLQVAGLAGTCAGARDLVERTRPAVLLLDIALPDGNGLDLVPELKRISPESHILVLTSHTDEETLLRAIGTGVVGFLGKNRSTLDVLAAIRQAAEGEIIMPPRLLLELLARTRGAQAHSSAELSGESLAPRERDILERLAQGKSSTAIAAEFDISLAAVRAHLGDLMNKLDVHSRLEAVAFASRSGLIGPLF